VHRDASDPNSGEQESRVFQIISSPEDASLTERELAKKALILNSFDKKDQGIFNDL